MTTTKNNKGGRPRKQPGEQRSAKIEAAVTLAEKQDLALEAELQGISEGEYVRRRCGIGGPAPGIRSGSSVLKDLEQRGIDVPALLSQDAVSAFAKEAGLEPEVFVRRMLEYTAATPQKRHESAIVSTLNGLWQQFRAIGNNANQIALAKHTSRTERLAWEDVIGRMDQLSEQAETAMEQVLGP